MPLCIAGCVEAVDFSPNVEPKVVVNCLLTNDDVQKLTLTYSASFEASGYQEVESAKVTLFEGGVKVGTFSKDPSSYGEWTLEYKPIYDKMYQLEVEVAGQPIVRAFTTFPRATIIFPKRELDKDGRRYFEKRADSKTFWVFVLNNPKKLLIQKSIIEPSYVLRSAIGTNYSSVDTFNKLSLDSEHNSDNNLHMSYLRMLPDETMNQFYLDKWLYNCVVVFRSVSDEYDQYLKSSLEKMLVYESFDDPTQWLDESKVYTNIENGLGIFGAYHDTIFGYGDLSR